MKIRKLIHFRKLAFILFLTHHLACTSISARPGAVVDDMKSQGPVGKTMKANAEKFAACGRDSISVQTGQEQNLTLRFSLDENGRVKRGIFIDDLKGPDPDLKACLIRALVSIRFPKPEGKKTAQVEYPLRLRAE